MILFRVILLLFIFISPIKANTIYYLIKIPNLEIYETNTKNNLRYFYATKPFQLSVEKNIKCKDSNKKTLDIKYKTVKKNLDLYSKNFLKKVNLKYIVLCENLSISGILTAGIPDHIMKTLIIDLKFNEKHFERVIHHEVFHIINDSFKDIFDKDEWVNFNEKNFSYTACSTCSNKTGLMTYKEFNGFFTEYSKSTASEDMAEVFSYIIFNKEIVKKKIINDPILKKKVNFIKNNILKIVENFEF